MLHTLFDPFGASHPFIDMRRIQRDMNRLLDGVGTSRHSSTYPPVNFWAGEDSIVMTAELPGLGEDDIELTVQDTMISLRGEFKDQDIDEDVSWHRRERPKGKFFRTVELPFRIDAEHVDARFENGVLTVEMQRPEDEKPKRISIKS
ncbi:Hsp20/alpha crystallin family protein [Leisingera aquaemixtae]|uniref:Spore protein SP21 n=1 Tax=Leisingera aquaemixtae TaxID=1396826 RepID=A0A0P1HDL8_9RHOB|nr:Hsp20/alpha crystallin family protein [Leisingera aquaemixtae]CUI01787.1 Spore protein SP21 [Leisingera aquaemixtae]